MTDEISLLKSEHRSFVERFGADVAAILGVPGGSAEREFRIISDGLSDVGRSNFAFCHTDATWLDSRCEMQGANNLLIVAAGARVDRTLFRFKKKGGLVIIGARALVESCTIQIEARDARLSMGADSLWRGGGADVNETGRQVTIGRGCFFEKDVHVQTSDSHPIFDANTGRRINPGASVSIGDHVWLGRAVKVVKGVRIGSGSAVRNGSIVTSSLGADSFAGGVPARVLAADIEWGSTPPCP